MHRGEIDFVETWMRCFAVHANNECRGENEITYLFLATAGCEAIMKISLTTYPRELEELTFNQIKKIFLKNIRPKKRLVVGGQTKFMALDQVEELILNFLNR